MISSKVILGIIHFISSFCIVPTISRTKWGFETTWLTYSPFPQLQFKLKSNVYSKMLLIRSRRTRNEYPHLTFILSAPNENSDSKGWLFKTCHYSFYNENGEKVRLEFNLDDRASFATLLGEINKNNPSDKSAFEQSFSPNWSLYSELNLTFFDDEPLFIDRDINAFVQDHRDGKRIHFSFYGRAYKFGCIDPESNSDYGMLFMADAGSNGEGKLRNYLANHMDANKVKKFARVFGFCENGARLGNIKSFQYNSQERVLGDSERKTQTFFYVEDLQGHGPKTLHRPMYEEEIICFSVILVVNNQGIIENEELIWSPLSLEKPTFDNPRKPEDYSPEVTYEDMKIRILA